VSPGCERHRQRLLTDGGQARHGLILACLLSTVDPVAWLPRIPRTVPDTQLVRRAASRARWPACPVSSASGTVPTGGQAGQEISVPSPSNARGRGNALSG